MSDWYVEMSGELEERMAVEDMEKIYVVLRDKFRGVIEDVTPSIWSRGVLFRMVPADEGDVALMKRLFLGVGGEVREVGSN